MQLRAACIIVLSTAVHISRHQEQAVQVHAEGQYRRKRPVDDTRDFISILVNQDVGPREVTMRKNLWILLSEESRKTTV